MELAIMFDDKKKYFLRKKNIGENIYVDWGDKVKSLRAVKGSFINDVM